MVISSLTMSCIRSCVLAGARCWRCANAPPSKVRLLFRVMYSKPPLLICLLAWHCFRYHPVSHILCYRCWMTGETVLPSGNLLVALELGVELDLMQVVELASSSPLFTCLMLCIAWAWFLSFFAASKYACVCMILILKCFRCFG